MKVLNGDIFGAKQAFQDILKVDWPVKTAWMLMKLANKVQSRFKHIETVRSGLVLKYGEENPETKQTEIKPDSEAWDDFAKDFNELMSQEDEIDMEPIVLPEECNGKPIAVSGSTLLALEKFVDVK